MLFSGPEHAYAARMGDPRDLDELLARADVVDAPSHTVRRAVGLGVALTGIGVAVAVGLTSGASAVLGAVLRAAFGRWGDLF